MNYDTMKYVDSYNQYLKSRTIESCPRPGDLIALSKAVIEFQKRASDNQKPYGSFYQPVDPSYSGCLVGSSTIISAEDIGIVVSVNDYWTNGRGWIGALFSAGYGLVSWRNFDIIESKY